MKKKRVSVYLLASVLFVASVCVVGFSTEEVRADLGSLVGDAVKKAGASAIEKVGSAGVGDKVKKITGKAAEVVADVVTKGVGGLLGLGQQVKSAYKNTIGLATAFVVLMSNFCKALVSMGYDEQVLNVYAELDVVEDQDTEASEALDEGEDYSDGTSSVAVVERKIGLEVDFGFVGAGEFGFPIEPVNSYLIYDKPVVVSGWELPADTSKLLKGVSDLVAKYKKVFDKFSELPGQDAISFIKKILGVTVGGLFTGFQEILKVLSRFARIRPEDILKFKFLLLLDAAKKGERVRWVDFPVEFVTLLSRFAESVNEVATKKLDINKGIEDPNEWKDKVYFKDSGISDSLELKEFSKFHLFKKVFEEVTFDISSWMVTEWNERKGKKGLTKLEEMYSDLCRLRGFVSRIAYFEEEILPFVEKTSLDKTDQALLMRLVGMLYSRCCKGVSKLVGLTSFSSVTEEWTGAVVDQGAVDLEMNNLWILKVLIETRWTAARDALVRLLAVMQKGGYSTNYVSKVNALIASLKSDIESYGEILKDVTWVGSLPEGKTLDDFGLDEETTALFSRESYPERFVDGPFLKLFAEGSASQEE